MILLMIIDWFRASFCRKLLRMLAVWLANLLCLSIISVLAEVFQESIKNPFSKIIKREVYLQATNCLRDSFYFTVQAKLLFY